ncbi:4464_t:CDS:2, partial [Racocetra persica]
CFASQEEEREATNIQVKEGDITEPTLEDDKILQGAKEKNVLFNTTTSDNTLLDASVKASSNILLDASTETSSNTLLDVSTEILSNILLDALTEAS